MPNSKSSIGKSRRYRSSVGAMSYRARTISHFDSTTVDSRADQAQVHGGWGSKVFAAFTFIIMVGTLYTFFTEDWFFIYRFEMQGLNYLVPKEVERASGVIGYNVFFVEPNNVERALKKMPEIKSARVVMGMPNTLLIQIEERAPEAVWLKGDQIYWVDGDGFSFKARVPRADLPTVRDLDSGEMKIGKRVQTAAMNAVRALCAAWSDAPRNLEWSSANGLSTTNEHGWKILFGDASDMEFKVAKLQALVPTLVSQGAKIKLIDLGKGDPYYQ